MALTADAGLVGRLDEQAGLGRWLGEASAGTPRIVMLTGEPGMGKTLLLRSLTDRAQTLGVMTAWGSVVEGVDVPFLAAGSLLAAIPGGGEALDSSSQAPGSWGAAESQNLVRAIDVVRRAAEDAPLLLVLDDVQWLDEATATFLQHLAIVVGTAAVPIHLLLAVAVRDGGGSEPGLRTARRLARESITRHVRVGPLDEVETRELWHRLDGRYPTKQELGVLIDRTGGCPLLIRARLANISVPGLAIKFKFPEIDSIVDCISESALPEFVLPKFVLSGFV